MPFPNQDSGEGKSRPFRKVTLDVDGVETSAPSLAVFERQQMIDGRPRLLIAATPSKPDLFRGLASCLARPLYLLYVLHTSRGEGDLGRYQSPPLDGREVDDFLAAFTPFLAADARHDTWVHSATDGRTLIWDRHDTIYAEGEPLEDMTAVLEAMGFEPGAVPRVGQVPHIHHYRREFDADARALLARFDWTKSDLQPEDEQWSD